MAGIAVQRTASLRSPMSRPSTSFSSFDIKGVDARHKAGHDAEMIIRRASSPVFFTGAGYAVVPPSPFGLRRTSRPPSKRTEGARDARVLTDPADLDTSQHRGVLKSDNRKSAVSMASRARCFEVCSASPPVDFPFQATRLSSRIGRPPIHRCGPRSGPANCDRLPFPPSRGPAARGWRAGTRRLGPPAGMIGAASPALPIGHRLPPRVRRRLIRRPSVTGRDEGI
jgi:hypothetical protein